jgi:putative ABC transport system permease protein
MLNDCRQAIRAFLRMPGFSATAILTLALGIGANTAIFSVVYGVLLKPLPFPDPGGLIYLHDTDPGAPVASVSWQKFVALRDGTAAMSSMAAMTPGTLTLTRHGEPQRLQVLRVSGDFFTVLGVAPLAGRTLNAADDVPNGRPVMVLSYGLWQGLFGGSRDILDHDLITDGVSRTVIGIMPPDFAPPARGEAWVPLALQTDGAAATHFLRLIGRMRTGVTLTQAAGDLAAVSARFNLAHGEQSRTVRVYRLQDFLTQGSSKMLFVLQGAVLMVLLVACANVANMLLARSVARRRELAIRAALGASPYRILRQLLCESVMLAAGGGLAGVLLAAWLVRLVLALTPAGFAGSERVAIDRHVLLFTAGVAVATGLLFGLAPARRGFRLDTNDGLRDGAARGATGRAWRGSSRVLIVAEISLAIMLVAGAGVMVKSLQRLQTEDPGFRPGGLLIFQIDLPQTRYDDAAARRAIAQIADGVRGVPGVTAAGAVNFMPLVQFGYSGDFRIQGEPVSVPADRRPITEFRMITPGYFSAMGIPLLAGSGFGEQDTAGGRPVAIINDAMARRFFPGRSPIGARIHLGLDEDDAYRDIVGVVGSVRSNTLAGAPVPESYVPHAQAPPSESGFAPASSMTFAVRAETDPAALLPAIRARLAAIDRDLPLVRPRTMTEVVTASAGGARLSSTLASLFALLAALLAAVGVYSLVAYSVAQRTREIGIRVALGAGPASVLRLALGESMGWAVCGVGLGLIGHLALGGTLRSLLFEVSPMDPVVLGATCAGLLAVTAAASFIPVQRVMRVDPTLALRAD